jgi:hypothetical protein
VGRSVAQSASRLVLQPVTPLTVVVSDHPRASNVPSVATPFASTARPTSFRSCDERGIGLPSLETCMQLATILKVSTDELLLGREPRGAGDQPRASPRQVPTPAGARQARSRSRHHSHRRRARSPRRRVGDRLGQVVSSDDAGRPYVIDRRHVTLDGFIVLMMQARFLR